HRLALALAGLARDKGAVLRFGAPVAEILVAGGRVGGVRLQDGEEIAAGIVISNADVNALATGRLGAAAARHAPPITHKARSLSAVTWAVAAETSGLALQRHNVVFSRDYRAEFEAIFRQGRLPDEPTIYVCAQDRDDGDAARAGLERLLILVNAPATGDGAPLPTAEIERCRDRTFARLAQCGLRLAPGPMLTTQPADWDRLFPGTGGALYGRATHGAMASFARPGSRSRLQGLYWAGGSVHPGPGVPMAALSGMLAAQAVGLDHAST
ncbi:MAG: phytoene desaturase family protein, partial [Bosea sp. (in: a-proteobacteria)]